MTKAFRLSLLIICILGGTNNLFSQNDSLDSSPIPEALQILQDTFIIHEFTLQHKDGQLLFQVQDHEGISTLDINGEKQFLNFKNGQARFNFEATEKGKLLLLQGDFNPRIYHISSKNNNISRVRHIPLWLSVLPPLVAIGLALIFKEVVVSLFLGIWTGAFIIGGLRIDSFYYILMSILEVVQKYIIEALSDAGHLSVIIFSLLIGGMVAIISRNGGMAGVVLKLSRFAKSPTSAQFITWLLGVAIFFDDYANTLIVGNTMRSVTDRFKISREKLAYIVDSTAAPVAAVALITTWIGAELGYIDSGIEILEGFRGDQTSYAIFLQSLKYSYYPALALGFILILIYSKRDFGPMYKAEIQARALGEIHESHDENTTDRELDEFAPIEGATLNHFNAVIPVILVIMVTIYGLFDTGMQSTFVEILEKSNATISAKWSSIWSNMDLLFADGNASFFRKIGKVIGNADSYVALLWASFTGVFVAIFLTMYHRIMKLSETMDTMVSGFKTMMPALIILTLAWALAATTKELHTAEFLTNALSGNLAPQLMPVVVFVLAAFISFATGSSWSTMAILYPIAIPTTWAICQSGGLDYDLSFEILLNVISVTLGASVLGDHCSPISDTTILSSLASDCSHIEHVRTQLPYALVVGIVSIICGGLSTYLGGGWLICFVLLVLAFLVLIGIVYRFGNLVDE